MSNSLRPHGLQPTSLLFPWDFPGKSTGVGAIAFSDIKLTLSLYNNYLESNGKLQAKLWYVDSLKIASLKNI